MFLIPNLKSVQSCFQNYFLQQQNRNYTIDDLFNLTIYIPVIKLWNTCCPMPVQRTLQEKGPSQFSSIIVNSVICLGKNLKIV